MTEKPLDANELMAFDVYFASIRSMQFHPGSGKRDHVALSAKECADEALEMLRVRRAILSQEG